VFNQQLFVVCRFYQLPGSGEDQVHSLTTKSNIMSAGQWMYKVGWRDMYPTEIQPADSYILKPTEHDDFFVEQCEYTSTYFTMTS